MSFIKGVPAEKYFKGPFILLYNRPEIPSFGIRSQHGVILVFKKRSIKPVIFYFPPHLKLMITGPELEYLST